MARLHDLPPVVESIESLKRRFIRQNREIARANSTQSIRIRTLESEVSHLLVENVSLREKAISLDHELDRYRENDLLDSKVMTMKEKLESKLTEISTLIGDLGTLSQKNRHLNATQKKETNVQNDDSTKCTIDWFSTKPSQIRPTLGDESRLPVILEGMTCIGHSTDEDATGGNEESVSGEESQNMTTVGYNFNDSSPRPSSPNPPTITESSDAAESGPPPNPRHTMERRRRRRDLSNFQVMLSEDGANGNEPEVGSFCPSKPGSKRKFDAQDGCETISQQQREDDDFRFTRLAGIGRSSSFIAGPEKKTTLASPSKLSCKPLADMPVPRRALKPKSSNANLRSPKKRLSEDKTGGTQESGYRQQQNTKPRSVSRSRRPDTCTGIKQEDPVNNDTQQPGASGDIRASQKELSITNTPSLPLKLGKENQIPKDTSPRIEPPSAVIANDCLAMKPRQSRRSRGAVSYAEPNLREKMRRPTEELVNAVSDDRFRRLSRSQLETLDRMEKAASPRKPQSEQSIACLGEGAMAEVGERTFLSNQHSPIGEHSGSQITPKIPISTLTTASKEPAESKGLDGNYSNKADSHLDTERSINNAPEEAPPSGTKLSEVGCMDRRSRRHSSKPVLGNDLVRKNITRLSHSAATHRYPDVNVFTTPGVENFDYDAQPAGEQRPISVKRKARPSDRSHADSGRKRSRRVTTAGQPGMTV